MRYPSNRVNSTFDAAAIANASCPLIVEQTNTLRVLLKRLAKAPHYQCAMRELLAQCTLFINILFDVGRKHVGSDLLEDTASTCNREREGKNQWA
jgi:hypothetical protein